MKARIWLFISLFLLLFCGRVFAQNVYFPYEPQRNEVVFNQSMYTIDVIDPKVTTNLRGANYPGLRGGNQLVIYTPSFGYRTNTNEFGAEAIVEGDTVTSLSGADSLIPANGLVISGHGRAKQWINENIMVGSKISIDVQKGVITSYVTSDTFLYAARVRIKEVQDMLLYYLQNAPNYNPRKTQQYIEKANDNITRAQRYSEDAQKYASRAIEYADKAMATVIPYDSDEQRGVWIRPSYYKESDIHDVLDRLEEAGINNIYLETYYHGKTIFPSETMLRYGFIRQNEEFVGFDPLRIWIKEAHKRGIKVNIWFETFYVGNKPPETNPEYILAKRPEWANYQKRSVGSSTIPYSGSEHNGYFLDPANPDVQNFLYELLGEIVTRYNPDGINLDYIRYPQSLEPRYSSYVLSNWGYTNFARKEFSNIYGIDPIELKTSDILWYQWKYYRMNKITSFVRRVSVLCHYNNIKLSTVIFPNRAMALDTKLQDWKNWSKNNFVDAFTPIFLTCDNKTAEGLMEEVLRNKSASTELYAGLFVTFMNGAKSDLIKQIHSSRRYSLSGVIIFDYAHLTDFYLDTLKESIFQSIREDKREIQYQIQHRSNRYKEKRRGR